MDKNRLLGGVITAVIVVCLSIPQLVAVLFQVPPSTRPEVAKAAAEAFVAMVIAFLVGWLLGGWSAGLMTTVIKHFLHLDLVVDPLAAGVGLAVVIMRLGPTLFEVFERRAARKLEGLQ